MSLRREAGKRANDTSDLPEIEHRDTMQAVVIKHCDVFGDFAGLRDGDVITDIGFTSDAMVTVTGMTTKQVLAELKRSILTGNVVKVTLIRTQDHDDEDDEHALTNPFSEIYSCDFDLVPAFKQCNTKEMLNRVNTEFSVPQHAFSKGLLVRRSAAALLDYSSQDYNQSNGYFQMGRVSAGLTSNAGKSAKMLSVIQPESQSGIGSHHGLFWDVINTSSTAVVSIDAIVAGAEGPTTSGKLYCCEGSFNDKEKVESKWTLLHNAVTLTKGQATTTELETPALIQPGATRGFYLHGSEHNAAVAYARDDHVDKLKWASDEIITVKEGNVTTSQIAFSSENTEKRQLAGGLKFSVKESLAVQWSTGTYKCNFNRQIILPMTTNQDHTFDFSGMEMDQETGATMGKKVEPNGGIDLNEWIITDIRQGTIASKTSLRIGDQVVEVMLVF